MTPFNGELLPSPELKNEWLTLPVKNIAVVLGVVYIFEKASRIVTYLLIISTFLHAVPMCNAQNFPLEEATDTTAHSINKKRLIPLASTGTALYAGSMVILYQTWYSDYEQQPFTLFNDNDQWLQMDKVGHAMTAYTLTELSDRTLRYSGVNRRTSLAIGSAVSLSYLGLIEVFDGFSAGWGFSMGDMLANVAGVGFYIGQDALWEEQRMRMKYNFLPSPYAAYRPDALGHNLLEQALKDYNGQAYWLSTNPHHWGDAGQWPKWLNFAFGYSARGMTGGNENRFPLLEPGVAPPDFKREREYYLSLDIDLYGIEAKRNCFKAFRTVFGFVKIPAPAIGITSGGTVIGGIR